MAEKDWQKVLRAIYENDVVWPIWKEYDDEHPIISYTELESDEVRDAILFLYQSGLIGRVNAADRLIVEEPQLSSRFDTDDPDPDGEEFMAITPEGFQVMHERDTNRTRHQTNFALVVLTLGLFGASMIQAVGEMYSQPTSTHVSVGILVLMAGALVALKVIDWGP